MAQMLLKMRAGSMNSAVTRANAENTTMPTRRNGNRISQINGNNISATSARGQHRTRRIHQRRNFTMSAFLPHASYDRSGAKVPQKTNEAGSRSGPSVKLDVAPLFPDAQPV